jgi:hypothetical protein
MATPSGGAHQARLRPTPPRSARLVVLAVVALVAAVLGMPGVARADEPAPVAGTTSHGGNQGGGSGGGGNSGGGNSGGGHGGQAPVGQQNPVTGGRNGSQTYGDCDIYANQAYFGSLCGSGATGTQTWREILAGDLFPRCRYTELPGGFPQPRAPKGKAGRWVIETCLTNADLEDLRPATATRESELFFLAAGKDIPRLTARQLIVWNGLASAYPTPILLTGPVDPPRVNVATTFWLGLTDEDASRAKRAAVTDAGRTFSTLLMTVVAGGGVPMRAFVARTLVWPGVVADEAPAQCLGAGVPRDAATGPVTADECAYSYTQSSAHLAGDKYQMTVEADWVVQDRPPGQAGWDQLAVVPITTTYQTKVDEIQTING